MHTLRIEKLSRGHEVDSFDCGREALNRFLIRYAFLPGLQSLHPGSGLLKDAMLRTLQAADIAGIRAFAAH